MSLSESRADFTSALFLGQRHPSSRLRPWEEFTTGVPAALRESPSAGLLASGIAARQHAASGLVARSALHALVDVLEALPMPGDVLLIDQAAYPLAQWACWAAEARGVRVIRFPHRRPPARPTAARTWIVTDGWCQGCGRPAPLAKMQTLILKGGGRVIVDDSLAFGVLGRQQGGSPFGDGTGTVRWSGLQPDGFVTVASLAKAYGTPVTVITGDDAAISAIAQRGSNRLHSSPPSAADINAGLDTLASPASAGRSRIRLYRHTMWLRRALGDLGLKPEGLPFPVVGTRVASLELARRWRSELAGRQLQVLVQLPRCHPSAMLSAVVRSDHRQADLDRLVRGLAAVTRKRLAA